MNWRNGGLRFAKHIQMFDDTEVATFLGGSRIIHIYGKIRDVPAAAARVDWDTQNQDPARFNEFGMSEYHTKMKTLLDAAYYASKGLRVIDPHDKGADDTEMMIARTAIAEAKRIFVLGYGFDEHNSSRLNLRDHLADAGGRTTRVAFTNYRT